MNCGVLYLYNQPNSLESGFKLFRGVGDDVAPTCVLPIRLGAEAIDGFETVL